MNIPQLLTESERKHIRALHKKSYRDESGEFIVEGEKLVRELVRSTYPIHQAVVRIGEEERYGSLIEELEQEGVAVYATYQRYFDPLSTAQTPQGIIAIAGYPNSELCLQWKSASPTEKQSIDTSFCVLMDTINDPGNLGTMIRTAHWFGCTCIIIGENSADTYNPKVIRATMGSLFFCPIVEADLPEFMKENANVDFFGASVHATSTLESIQSSRNVGVVIGSESHGISYQVAEHLTTEYTIKGYGSAESLNASVAGGISLYYFANQRNLPIK
jgi:RNA methyltransferase, TrmH family